MSNNTTPATTAQNVTASVKPATAQAYAAQVSVAASVAARITSAGVMGRINAIRLFDYAFKPDHPQGWQHITTRDLADSELFDVQAWLRLMTSSDYDTITHYTPAMRMLVYFERSQDAAMFKLAWGGE